MAIYVDESTRLVVQGLTGREGGFHAFRNRDYGTNLVAGVTPGKGGTDLDGVPLDFSLGPKLTANRGVLATNGSVHDLILESLARVGRP